MSIRTLQYGFYGEGVRDYGFLSPIVQRTLEKLLPYNDVQGINLDYIKHEGTEKDRIIRIAEHTKGLEFVIYHLDADGPNEDAAFKDRFEPGYKAIAGNPDRYNLNIVPIIPVRMTDAWIIADFELFRAVVGTDLSRKDLGFKSKPREVESILNPKQVFEGAVSAVKKRRRKKIPLNQIYEDIALQMDLGLLQKVPAYQKFLSRLNDKLEDLHYSIE